MSDDEIIITSDVSVTNLKDGSYSVWACYIKAGADEHKMVQPFKAPTSVAEGELRALINAVHVADMLYGIEDRRLTIYFDSAYAMTITYRKDNGEPRKKHVQRHKTIEEFLTPYLEKARSHQIIWLNGHGKFRTDAPKEVYAMHRWCDKASRDMSRYLRRMAKKATVATAP